MDLGQLLQEYFTPELCAAIVTTITTIGVVIKTCFTLGKVAKEKVKTADDICGKVVEVAKNTTENALNTFKPEIDAIKGYLTTITKAIALLAENTPTSRLALLELLEKLGTTETQVIEEAKETIIEEVKKEEEIKTEKIEVLEQIASEGRY